MRKPLQCELWVGLAQHDESPDAVYAKGYRDGRRDGLGTAVKALRACIDARFRLDPEEFVIGELPEGLDMGELLEAMNQLLIEYGARSFHDGIVVGARTATGQDEEPDERTGAIRSYYDGERDPYYDDEEDEETEE